MKNNTNSQTIKTKFGKMKPTQTNLAEYIGITKQGITKMKNERHKVFELLWLGWVQKCNDTKVTKDN